MGMPIITPGTVTRETAIGDIIESVAMGESALAHILNAESEKITAVVEMSNITTSQLLKMNRSVKNMVHSIATLEMYMEAKLNLFDKPICQRE